MYTEMYTTQGQIQWFWDCEFCYIWLLYFDDDIFSYDNLCPLTMWYVYMYVLWTNIKLNPFRARTPETTVKSHCFSNPILAPQLVAYLYRAKYHKVPNYVVILSNHSTCHFCDPWIELIKWQQRYILAVKGLISTGLI